jgi:signal transduction histidine kinase
MINYFRRHLGGKLFLSYIAVILVGVTVLALATTLTVPQAYNQHMRGMQAGQGMGMMNGNPGAGTVPDLYRNFQVSFNEALLLAALAAGLIAILVSLFLSRGITAPVRALTNASRDIADGQYSKRVVARSSDELGELAHSFNQMAEKLEQVEAMRRQLVGDVSHELRTPLSAIKGSMEGLIDGVLPATPETYQQIRQEADRLARLVDDLQELSRVEAGAYSLEKHPTSVVKLIQVVLNRLSPQASTKNIVIHQEIPDDLPSVLVDADRITQVLINLVGNAVQYTPAGGEVTLSAERKAKEVLISVADTGIGIPAEHLAHLFTRFYRVDKSRSRQAGGGSGIGLTIARYMVEAHGGRIWAESNGDGKGSTFNFTLPFTSED